MGSSALAFASLPVHADSMSAKFHVSGPLDNSVELRIFVLNKHEENLDLFLSKLAKRRLDSTLHAGVDVFDEDLNEAVRRRVIHMKVPILLIRGQGARGCLEVPYRATIMIVPGWLGSCGRHIQPGMSWCELG